MARLAVSAAEWLARGRAAAKYRRTRGGATVYRNPYRAPIVYPDRRTWLEDRTRHRKRKAARAARRITARNR